MVPDDPSRENERLSRRGNDLIRDTAAGLGADESTIIPLLCECSDVECTETIHLSQGEYDRVRREPNRFVVLPGHETEAEEVVAAGARRHIVEETDVSEPAPPRSRRS